MTSPDDITRQTPAERAQTLAITAAARSKYGIVEPPAAKLERESHQPSLFDMPSQAQRDAARMKQSAVRQEPKETVALAQLAQRWAHERDGSKGRAI
ncbi:MAG: hypothetical protein JWP29_1980 [Rhodoferax sp.]|nr:hypothetical protein [Rhodoferax sp.]